MKEEKIGALVDEIKGNMAEIKRVFNLYFYQPNEKLSRHQVFCLHLLAKSDAVSMSELAEKMDVSNQQLTRIVDSLADNGLIDRFISPENRRVVLVKASENGRRFVTNVDQKIKKRTTDMLGCLSEEDLDKAIEYIRALKALILKLGK